MSADMYVGRPNNFENLLDSAEVRVGCSQVSAQELGHIVSAIVSIGILVVVRIPCCLSIQLHERAVTAATASCSALNVAQ